MLDQFIVGHVSRISPEAPVPVVAFDRDEYRAGGAANVALNARALGAQRRARRRRSATTMRRERLQRSARAPPDVRAARARSPIEARRTTTKVRIVTTRNQQVARVDYENDEEVSARRRGRADRSDRRTRRSAPARSSSRTI